MPSMRCDGIGVETRLCWGQLEQLYVPWVLTGRLHAVWHAAVAVAAVVMVTSTDSAAVVTASMVLGLVVTLHGVVAGVVGILGYDALGS